MNRHVNAIAGRLSLRHPQRNSLEILDRICKIIPPRSDTDLQAVLNNITSEYPTVTDFERDFSSLCFALATGVGKTRLMGAFITYLHLAHGIRNFFVLAPNLTLYNKLIADFTPNTPKYVFKGISEFATVGPEIITGDNYENASTITDFVRCKINIFNISKINSEVRGGKSPRIKRLSEYIGESYFDYLAHQTDLVMLMDESHRYRASAGIKAINDLKPILGLELTATPFIESKKGAKPFKNVVYDYPLGRAIADGFVKDPTVVTRKDFNPSGMSTAKIEQLKLEDGMRLHESLKVDLATYAQENQQQRVKPFVLVIAQDTDHAAQLLDLIKSNEFFRGGYADKVIQVDSSTKGKKEDELIERLLKVESTEEPTEIVIHVNMLKEGWDVTNLYTIIPLRAAKARILIEQSIGRGLRLPYGKRTGMTAVDRLNIIAHDRFQEIVDEANQPNSPIRLQQVILEADELEQPKVAVAAPSNLASQLGLASSTNGGSVTPPIHSVSASALSPAFKTSAEQEIAQIAYKAIQKLENQPQLVPTKDHLLEPSIQARVKETVVQQYRPPQQLELEGVDPPDIEILIMQTVVKTASLVVQQTIDIPRISVVPKGAVRVSFHPFQLQLSNMQLLPPSQELWLQSLATQEQETLRLGQGGIHEDRLEDYVVGGLIDFDDVSYDDNADLLYDLATQVVAHCRGYLAEEDDIHKVLRYHQKQIADLVHSQMQEHLWEEDAEYEVVVSRGFTSLKDSAYTASADDEVLDYRQAPKDKSNMTKYLFGGFSKCLYSIQKFQSNTERMLAVILERDALKWFRPAKGQFQLFYQWQGRQPEYQPDFVAETETTIYMLEPKIKSQMSDGEVLAKQAAAVQWCQQASGYAQQHEGKPWVYVLMPHDVISENMTLEGLVTLFH